MHGYYIFTVLVLFTTLFTYINSRWVRLPVSIAVTIFSLLVSSALLLLYDRFPELNQIIRANLDHIQFDEIVIDILLGFLLFSAAFQLNVTNFTRQLPEVLSLAIVSTLVSTFLVGTLVYFSFHLLHQNIPFVQCLLFGSIISPTDPIAALAVLSKIGISKKFELLITGESLLNDGIAIVLFMTLLNLATTHNDDTVWQDGGLLFLKEAGGALLFGLALGGVAYLLLKSLSNYKVEILVTLSVVMGGYTLAKMIDVSPPLSMVVTGLVCSAGRENSHHIVSHEFVVIFWQIIENFINVVLFLLIGLGVFVIPLDTNVILIAGISIVCLLVSRYLSLLPVYALLRSRFEKHALPLLTWAALRGAVSIALALSIPASLHRTEFLVLTFIIAVFSIVVQGLTIKPLARRLGFGAK